MCGVQMFGCMLVLHIVFPHRGVFGIVSLGICSDSTKRTKSLVSLMCEGSCFTTGWRYVCASES